MSKAIIKYLNGKTAEVTLNQEKIDGGVKLTIPMNTCFTG